jgi:hypothetical protein
MNHPNPKYDLGDIVKLAPKYTVDKEDFLEYKIIGLGWFVASYYNWVYILNRAANTDGLAWLERNCEPDTIKVNKIELNPCVNNYYTAQEESLVLVLSGQGEDNEDNGGLSLL